MAPLAMVAAAYLLCLLVLPSRGFWINDNGAKLIQVQGLLQSHWRDYALAWPGRELDPDFRYNPIPPPIGRLRGSRLDITYSEFFALCASLLFRLFGSVGLCLLPLASGLLTLAGVWRLARSTGGGSKAADLALMIAGLGTPLWFYSISFWEAMPAVASGLWSLNYLILDLRRPARKFLAVSGLLAALACYFRAEMLLWASALAGVWFLERRQWRGLVLFGFSLLAGLIPLLLLQEFALSSPLGLHLAAHSPFAAGWLAFLRERREVAWMLLLRGDRNHWLSLGLMAPFVVLFLLYPSVNRSRLVAGFPLLAGFGLGSGLMVLAGQIRSAHPMQNLIAMNGLFASAPVLILGLVQVKQDPGSSLEAGLIEPTRWFRLLWRLAAGFTILYLLFSPTSSQGVHWGGRFLLILYPLLSIPAAANLKAWFLSSSRLFRSGRLLVCLLAALSILAQVYSFHLLRQRADFTSRLNETVAQRPEPVIIATEWYIPQELAFNFYSRPIFLVRNPRNLVPLFRKLQNNGFEQALVVSPSQAPKISPGEGQVLDDGLGFVSLRLQSVPMPR